MPKISNDYSGVLYKEKRLLVFAASLKSALIARFASNIFPN